MALQKGCIKKSRTSDIGGSWVLTGILIGLCYSLVLYGIFISFFEAFRVLTYGLSEVIISLTDWEKTFYKTFYASLSSVVGCSFALKFIFENSAERYLSRNNIRRKAVINDNNFYTWNTLYWFSKSFGILGIFYIMLPLNFEINFSSDHLLFLILFVLVWYSILWLKIFWAMGSKTYSWVGIATAIILVNIFFITKIQIADTESYFKHIVTTSIDFNYKIRVPETRSYQHIKQAWDNIHFFIGYGKEKPDSVQVVVKEFLDENHSPITFEEFPHFLSYSMDGRSDVDWWRTKFVLHIDKDVPMEFINKLERELGKYGRRDVYYATFPKHTTSAKDNPVFKTIGIKSQYFWDCPDAIKTIDSLKTLEYKPRQIRFPDVFCYRMAQLSDYNRILVRLNAQGDLFANEQSISLQTLEEAVSKLFDLNTEKKVILFDVNEKVSFGRYMEVLDVMREVVISKRRKAFLENFNNEYYPGYHSFGSERPDSVGKIIDKYPLNILVLTKNDLHLYNFLKSKNQPF